MKYASIGSISSGTLRTEDLLYEFASEITYQVQRNAEEWCSDEGRARRDKLMVLAAAEEIEDPDSPEASEYVEEMIDALNEFSPPYCYFGTHPGDGADFGYWPCMDQIDELPCYESTDAAKDAGEENDFRTVTDHGNVTVWSFAGNEILSIV